MQITNLSKSFDSHPVLSHLSLSIEEHGVYALMGASGRGKTTLLHILMGLEKPDGGTLSGFEEKKISAVFQENRLLEFLTAAENIDIILSGAHPLKRNLHAINRILAEILPSDALPAVVRTYSGGMKRRAAIARAMLADSALLIMDEPFSGLDEKTKEQVISFIKKYRHDRTLLFSTHALEDAAAFDASILQL